MGAIQQVLMTGGAGGAGYYNDFTNPSLADFTPLADGGSGTVTWAVTGGVLSATGGVTKQIQFVYNGYTALDGYSEAVFLSSQNAGLAARLVDAGNFYTANVFDASGAIPNTYAIYRRVSGSFVLVANGPIASWTRGTPRTFRLAVVGTGANNIFLYDGGALIRNTSDSSITSVGKFGLTTYGTTSYPFSVDSVQIGL